MNAKVIEAGLPQDTVRHNLHNLLDPTRVPNRIASLAHPMGKNQQDAGRSGTLRYTEAVFASMRGLKHTPGFSDLDNGISYKVSASLRTLNRNEDDFLQGRHGTTRARGILGPLGDLQKVVDGLDDKQIETFLERLFIGSTKVSRPYLADLPSGLVAAKFNSQGQLDVKFGRDSSVDELALDISKICLVAEGLPIDIESRHHPLWIESDSGWVGQDGFELASFSGVELNAKVPLGINRLAPSASAVASGGGAELRIGKIGDRTSVWARDNGKVEIIDADLPAELGVDTGGTMRIGYLHGRRNEPTKLKCADGVIVILEIRSTQMVEGIDLASLRNGLSGVHNVVIEKGQDRGETSIVSKHFPYQIRDASHCMVDPTIILQEAWLKGKKVFIAMIDTDDSEYRSLAVGTSMADASASGQRVLRKTGDPFAPIRR